MRDLPSLLLASCLASLAAGCTLNDHPAGLQDNLAITLDNSNVLHTPYVAGSRFTISVEAGDNAKNDGWKLASSDPGVIEIGTPPSPTDGNFPVQAMAAGHATLTVTDKSGKVIDTADVDVDVPTRIQLCEQGLLYAGYSDDQAALSSLQVVNGGTATFLARYFSGSQELFGNNALSAINTPEALASVTSTSFSVRDFLQITGVTTGATIVQLAAGGTSLDVPVTVVDPSVVRKVSLAQQSEDGASDGNELFVFARAFDGSGQDVYGASFGWMVNGNPLAGYANSNDPTDLLMYAYKGSSSEDVSARLDGEGATATVHGTPASTSTSSSENTGCSVAHGAGAPGSAAMAILVGLAMLASRRRRA